MENITDEEGNVIDFIWKVGDLDKNESAFLVISTNALDEGLIPNNASVNTSTFDFIFADPPYALKELGDIPDLIFKKNLLKDRGLFVLEHGKEYDFSKHEHFLEHREYGSVNFSFFR